jgi:colicin import membrane protein
MIGLALFVALIAVLAAVAFFLQSRTARQVAQDRAAAAEKLSGEVEKVQKDVAALRAEAKERREEATGLRAELAATKKKAFEQAEAAKKAGGAAALRTEIDKLTTRLAEARAEAAHQSERARAADAAAEKQRQEVERLRAQAERRAEPAPVAPTPAPVAAPAPAAPAGVDPVKLAAEKDRADKAESRLAEARKRVAELERDLKGVRGRLETEKRVYMVQKGELELASDRHAELRRRYDALRKDHEELLDAVRQAAREEQRHAGSEAPAAAPTADAKSAAQS